VCLAAIGVNGRASLVNSLKRARAAGRNYEAVVPLLILIRCGRNEPQRSYCFLTRLWDAEKLRAADTVGAIGHVGRKKIEED
jgi:hypothetical protein